MKITKSIGPKTVPWGTPDVAGTLFDISPSRTTVWGRSVTKSVIQLSVWPVFQFINEMSKWNFSKGLSKIHNNDVNLYFVMFD